MVDTVDINHAWRDVEVRSWPERADLLVIDVTRALVIAHYELGQEDEQPEALFLDSTPYEQRRDRALANLESDQDYLRAHFAIADQNVCLRAIEEPRAGIEELLAQYDLSLAAIEMVNMTKVISHLNSLDLDRLYLLLADWHDVVERHYPAGSSLADETSWVSRAQPHRPGHFHFLATGAPSPEATSEAGQEDAYQLFVSLVNVAAEEMTFGHVLRWVYFHRSEFPARTQPTMAAFE